MVQIHPSLPSTILVVVVLWLQAVKGRLQSCVGRLFTCDNGRLLRFKTCSFSLKFVGMGRNF